jgi:dipeptidyl aminopeptidase/acylaminoacyl peptidase
MKLFNAWKNFRMWIARMSISNHTTGKNKPSNKFSIRRWLILILAAAFLTYEIGIAAASYFYVDSLLNPGCETTLSEKTGYESWQIPSRTGYSLPAWWRPGTNGAAIILLPGNGGSRDTLLAEAKLLASHGYGVLSLSPRACVGLISTLGLREADDLSAAASVLSQQPSVAWIGVLGFSAGGVAAILGAVETPQIQAVIAEGHYRSLDFEINNSRAIPLSTEWHVQRWVSLWFRIRTGVWPGQISPIAALPALARPVLLIFGEEELENTGAREQFLAAVPPRQLWIVPGAGHGDYFQTNPLEYEKRVLDFLDQAYSEP